MSVDVGVEDLNNLKKKKKTEQEEDKTETFFESFNVNVQCVFLQLFPFCIHSVSAGN